MATRNEFLPEALFKFDHLETRVQKHLKKVYGTLSISMLAAAAGAYVHLFTNILSSGILTAIASIGMLLWLAATHHSKENEKKRLGIFVGFTFLCGISLGPVLQYAIHINPSIISTALMGTCLIFISFSLAALYNTNRAFLYMGGFLLSALSWMCLLGLMNIFFHSKLIYDVNLYGGLLIFCAFVLYDTQLIVEKARSGDDDYICSANLICLGMDISKYFGESPGLPDNESRLHSIDLFLDFINIFRRLLIILSNKESSNKKKRND